MKKIILILFVGLYSTCFNLKAQEISQLDSLINISLLNYMNNLKGLCNKGALSEDYLKNIYISVDNYPRNFSFCKKLQDMELKYISLTNISNQKLFKKKKGYNVIFLEMKLTDNCLKIIYSDRNVSTHQKNNIKIGLSNWGNFVYKYSCERQKWLLMGAEYGGV